MGLKGKHIVLGVTGSIAAYKAADLASKLVQQGAQVSVIMTRAAQEFITPLTFRSITHQPVVAEWWDPDSALAIQHVQLAESADAVLVAPATADIIAKIAHGLADDPLTGTVLATQAPLLLAPAMDAHMFENPATQRNVSTLKAQGATFIGPERGRLASGLTGYGRLAAPETILGVLAQVLGRNGDLAGRTIVVSAGGTQEPIDPVRIITNRSSGKMGYALAEAARDRGATVAMITAASLPDPVGIQSHHVETVAQMREAVLAACAGADALIMAAAVSDYRPAEIASQKIKKGPEGDGLTLRLVKNQDFFLEVPLGVLRVGFAAESEDLLNNARKKIKAKDLAFIAANDITLPNSGFGADDNKVTLLDASGDLEDLPLMSKYQVADRILDRVVKLLGKQVKRPTDA